MIKESILTFFWDADFNNHIKFEVKSCFQGETDSFRCFTSEGNCSALLNFGKKIVLVCSLVNALLVTTKLNICILKTIRNSMMQNVGLFNKKELIFEANHAIRIAYKVV